MFGSTNTKLWSGGAQYGYIMAEYPEGSQCQITRELDDTILKARGSGSNWAFALPEMITSIKVPNEYQQVDYIQATGTQYIILTFPTAVDVMALRYVMDILMHRTSSTSVMLGNTTPQPYFGALWYNGSNFYPICTYNGATQSPSNDSLLGQRFTYELIGSDGSITIKANDTIWVENSARNSSTRTQIGIFCDANGNRYKASGRLYHLTIYGTDHVTKLFDLYPVYRKIDSVIGLYDIVNDVFYTNQGTGVFIAGPEAGDTWTAYCTDGENEAEKKVNILYNGDIKSTKLYYRVPAEYQAVEYLERPEQSGAYFNTGIVPARTNFVEVRYKILTWAGYPWPIGLEVGGGYYGFSYQPGGTLQFLAYPNSATASGMTNCDAVVQFTGGNKVRYSSDDGENYTEVSLANSTSPTNPFLIFAVGSGLVGKGANNMRVKRVTIADAEFIPCYRKSDNAPGFWNSRDEAFITKTGADSILVGPDM